MAELVKLWRRDNYGKGCTYYLDYKDLDGKRRRTSLGHGNKRRAERQQATMEADLREGYVEPRSMRLSVFMADSLTRTGDQIRESSRHEYKMAMLDFIDVIGDIDFQLVRSKHGERYRQECLDKGNSPSTVGKKLRHLKRFFQLALERDQLDKNPLAYVKVPRVTRKKVRIYTPEECRRLLKTAHEVRGPYGIRWEVLLSVELATGMRRGEILNTTWRDVNFDKLTIEVNPKKNTDETWEWYIKDAEHRVLPLTEELINMLAAHQNEQPEGFPYLFVPPARYERIQELRKQGKWTYADTRLKLISNFRRSFIHIQKRAGIEQKTFHELRKTTLSNWLSNGMSEYDVMTLAGHSSFSTTHTFYLAVNRNLVDRAREATADSVRDFVTGAFCGATKKWPAMS